MPSSLYHGLSMASSLPSDVDLKPGDIFLTRGQGFVSWAIRCCTRNIGEKRTQVNHVGIVVEEGSLRTCNVVEALMRVMLHPLWRQYGPENHTLVSVYRPLTLTPEEIAVVVAEAREQIGKGYGFLKLFAHLLDWLLQGVYFFRRFVGCEKYPICSWLVAHAYSRAGKHFGCEPGAAEPDDIWDFVTTHHTYYKRIHPSSKSGADAHPLFSFFKEATAHP